jgi:hypothetical protein
MNTRRHVAIAILFGALLLTRSASAANGGVLNNTDATYVPFFLQSQSPGVTWTFSTSNLSAGSDTVIHVQDFNDAQGAFIAGDDDGNGGFASRVVVPPAAQTRMLTIIVRAYGALSSGTCTLTATPSSGTAWTNSISFAGVPQPVGNLGVGSHITMAERQGGATDTVLLAVLDSNRAHAVAFDDDDGVGRMPWMHINESCPSCWLITGTFSNNGVQKTNLIWDEDADTNDADCDGMGLSLETAIGTTPNNHNAGCNTSDTSGTDSDQDGLSDGAEVFGVDVFPPMMLPAWGSNPLVKDMFVEVDWQKCTDASCNGDLDAGQFGQAPAQSATALVQQVNTELTPVSFHFDIGRVNTDPSTWTLWGSWGGAFRVDVTTDKVGGDIDGCQGMTDPWKTYFHHAVSFNLWTGHVWNIPGSCFVTMNRGRTVTHETGHRLGILHGGRPNRISMNYKPQYISVMNYIYQEDVPSPYFSMGVQSIMNPTALSEWNGLNIGNPFVLNKLRDAWCPVPKTDGKCVNVNGNAGVPNLPIGAVDWNRDGIYEPSGTTVRGAAVMWSYAEDLRSEFTDQFTAVSMAWVSVGGLVGDRLFMFGRGPGSELRYTYLSRTTLESGCGTITSLDDEGTFNCAQMSGTVSSWPNGKKTETAPGVAELNNQLVVISQDCCAPGAFLRSNTVTINSTTGNLSFGPDVFLPGNVHAAGDVTALSTGSGQVTVYAVSGGRLKEWVLNGTTWTGPVDQQWDEGSFPFINPIYGIGATRGFQDTATVRTYALIPDNSSSNGGLVQFARKSVTNGRWVKMPSIWTTAMPQPKAGGRPGLTYLRKAGQPNEVGRFYMGLPQVSACTGPYSASPCESKLMMTEGNQTTGTTKRLVWITPAQRFGQANLISGISLISDLTRDTNVRGMSARPWVDKTGISHTTAWFAPIVDGIVNANLADNDDRPYISGALRASLVLDCPSCTWPRGQLPPSLP